MAEDEPLDEEPTGDRTETERLATAAERAAITAADKTTEADDATEAADDADKTDMSAVGDDGQVFGG